MPIPLIHRSAGIAALLFALGLPVPAQAQADALQEAGQLLKQGRPDAALERVDGYLKSRPKDARGRFLKGLILAEQNRPEDAIKVFTELTQDFPELPEPYNNLAVLYASQGQYDKARTALEMAIRTHPSYATAHENLGDIYAKMASQAYDKALQLDKGNTPLQTKLNLIKDLFTGAPRPAVTASRAEAAGLATTAPPRAVAPAAPPPPRKPAPATKAAAPVTNPDEVLKAVSAWARAWSENDVPGYFSHYAADFRPAQGMDRSEWENQRRARIAKPRRIQVDVESPRVVFGRNGRVTVTFLQRYQSGALKIANTKTLVMVRSGDRWLILQERAGG